MHTNKPEHIVSKRKDQDIICYDIHGNKIAELTIQGSVPTTLPLGTHRVVFAKSSSEVTGEIKIKAQK